MCCVRIGRGTLGWLIAPINARGKRGIMRWRSMVGVLILLRILLLSLRRRHLRKGVLIHGCLSE